MKSPDEAITDFQGIAKDVAPAKLPPQLFQEDKGGDRTRRGSWKRRRGFLHTNAPVVSSPITCITGFHIPFSYGYIIVEGTNIQGTTGVDIQTDDAPLLGRFLFDDDDLSHEILFLFYEETWLITFN